MTLLAQRQLRTRQIKQTENISFPIGTVLAVQEYYEYLELEHVFGKHKKKGVDLNALIQPKNEFSGVVSGRSGKVGLHGRDSLIAQV